MWAEKLIISQQSDGSYKVSSDNKDDEVQTIVRAANKKAGEIKTARKSQKGKQVAGSPLAEAQETIKDATPDVKKVAVETFFAELKEEIEKKEEEFIGTLNSIIASKKYRIKPQGLGGLRLYKEGIVLDIANIVFMERYDYKGFLKVLFSDEDGFFVHLSTKRGHFDPDLWKKDEEQFQKDYTIRLAKIIKKKNAVAGSAITVDQFKQDILSVIKAATSDLDRVHRIYISRKGEGQNPNFSSVAEFDLHISATVRK